MTSSFGQKVQNMGNHTSSNIQNQIHSIVSTPRDFNLSSIYSRRPDLLRIIRKSDEDTARVNKTSCRQSREKISLRRSLRISLSASASASASTSANPNSTPTSVGGDETQVKSGDDDRTILLGYEEHMKLLQSASNQNTKAEGLLRNERLQWYRTQFAPAIEHLKKTDAGFSRGRKTAPSKWANREVNAQSKQYSSVNATTIDKKTLQKKTAQQNRRKVYDSVASSLLIRQLGGEGFI